MKNEEMKIDLYQVDAFTDTLFGGNPACVVPLDSWLSDELMFQITRENAVPETAFFIDNGDVIQLRWFTPEIEMDLCGHATLATAHVLKSILKKTSPFLVFETLSGTLTVKFKDGFYVLDFPSRMPLSSDLPDVLKNALSIQPREVFKARDFVLIYDSESDIKNIKINRQYFDRLNMGAGGVIVTSKGNECDFVSRFFTPKALLLEDPVTGSAHCSLTPFWSKRFKKKILEAQQISARRGKITCEDKDDRVLLKGQARTYSIGSFWIK
tara:strand:+ start:1043 stop:1846 length:804 start_codon:yes stop_codon:yes gene_type:complete